jgi:hypothetical protein
MVILMGGAKFYCSTVFFFFTSTGADEEARGQSHKEPK